FAHLLLEIRLEHGELVKVGEQRGTSHVRAPGLACAKKSPGQAFYTAMEVLRGRPLGSERGRQGRTANPSFKRGDIVELGSGTRPRGDPQESGVQPSVQRVHPPRLADPTSIPDQEPQDRSHRHSQRTCARTCSSYLLLTCHVANLIVFTSLLHSTR